jgi:hypothetical protein
MEGREMARKKDSEEKTPIIAIKGFDPTLSCRGHKFEVGKTYTVKGEIRACENGFHACENPLDVWSYYPIVADDGKLNRFAVVEMSGAISRHEGDSKIASASITVKAELSLPEFIGKAVSWIVDYTKLKAAEKKGGAEVLNDNGGHSARIGSSGDSARIGSSGHYAQIGSSGDSAQIGSSGHSAQIGSSGHSARIGSSGHSAQIVSEGDNAVIASAGANTYARGKLGAWISLAEFDGNGKCVGFATGCIGKDGLEPDVMYRASGGKLVRV